MTNKEMTNGAYAVMTNKPFCTNGKPKRLSPEKRKEVKEFRDQVKSVDMKCYYDEKTGEAKIEVIKK